MGLERFHEAQDVPGRGYAGALRELREGRKTGHWIWYVFPQLKGLGQSFASVHYGLDGLAEAAAYLRDPVLGERLVEAAGVVRAHLTGPAPLSVVALMGGTVDALKLVSCMTLFRHVTRTPGPGDRPPRFAMMAEHADMILAAARGQGYDACRYTEEQVRRGFGLQ